MDLDDVMQILHHLPNLVYFAFDSNYLSTTQPLVQHPHLATPIINTYVDPANLFDCLVVPHLHHLDVSLIYLDFEDHDPVWWGWLEPLLSLIFWSSCSIQSFMFKT